MVPSMCGQWMGSERNQQWPKMETKNPPSLSPSHPLAIVCPDVPQSVHSQGPKGNGLHICFQESSTLS